MFDFIAMRDRLAEFPTAEMLIGLCLLVLLAFVADFVVRRILTRLILRIVGRAVHDLDALLQPVVRSFTRVVPAIIIHQGIGGVPHLSMGAVTLIQNVAGAFMIVAVAIGIGAGLDMANALYVRSPRAHRRSIKGYLQVLKIVIYAIATILVIAALIDRSPLLLLSGLGALAAVLMLVFKDTILSLVASVQLNSNDMLRVGDWIEMPQLNADGDVIDIALHTVKVQNWDKTITTIPTWRMINESYKNWRGRDAGKRRPPHQARPADRPDQRALPDRGRARPDAALPPDRRLSGRQGRRDGRLERQAGRGRARSGQYAALDQHRRLPRLCAELPREPSAHPSGHDPAGASVAADGDGTAAGDLRLHRHGGLGGV